MLLLGSFKGVGKLKLTKLLAMILFSGTVFNLSLITSNMSNSRCKESGGKSDETLKRYDVNAEIGLHRKQLQYGDTTGNVTRMKHHGTGGLELNVLPLREPVKNRLTNLHKGGNRTDTYSQFFQTNSTNLKHRTSNNSIDKTFFISSKIKQMISTMPRTIHNAPWGKIPQLCVNKTILPSTVKMKASVVITFHDSEKLVRILHTIHSIIQRTPSDLLQEIILIDDHGKREELDELLKNYINSVFGPKVILRDNWLKRGLIGARLAGTRLAKGDIIVCMDSHMEVQEHWLEPLLHEIDKNPKTLAASYLDWIEYDTSIHRWKYRHGASTWKTYFDWTFTFGFQDTSYGEKDKRGPVEPIESPVTIGTIFAIRKQFFTEIGEFDEEMVGWGGENLDLPLRVWMFGGRVVNVPCSHVAHYEENGQRNYRLGWDKTIAKNYRRVAEVWLGNYKQMVFDYRVAVQLTDPGNLTSRFELQKKSLHDFSWYLKNVFPELGIPQEHSLAWGGLKNIGSGYCLHSTPPNPPVIMHCLLNRPEKTGFFWSKTGELRFPLHAFSASAGYKESPFRVDEWIPLHNTSLASKWIHWKNGPLIEWTSRRCLTTFKSGYRLKLVGCDFNSTYQQWTFSHYTDSYSQLLKPLEGVVKYGFKKVLNEVLQWKNTGQNDKLYNFTWHRSPT